VVIMVTKLSFFLILFGLYFCEEPSIRFITVGDWGSQYPKSTFNITQKAVAKAMGIVADELPINFIVSVGDNIYPSGVLAANDSKFESYFQKIYTAPSLSVPWYLALGNHDYEGELEQGEIKYSGKNWRMPARSYIEKITTPTCVIYLIVLDSIPFHDYYYTKPKNLKMKQNLASQNWTTQATWLESSLQKIREDNPNGWVFVYSHHPMFVETKISSPLEENKFLVDRIYSVLQKYRCNIFFSGHDHLLYHIRNGRDYPSDFIVSGGGSQIPFPKSKKRNNFDNNQIQNAKKIYQSVTPGFVLCEVYEDRTISTFYSHKNKIFS